MGEVVPSQTARLTMARLRMTEVIAAVPEKDDGSASAHVVPVSAPGVRLRMSESGLGSRAWPVQTAMRNCTRDEGGPFEFGNQVLTSSHRKLLSSKAMVVSVAETLGQ